MRKYEVALKILNVLYVNNYEAYIVGGFVKDKLLNIDNHDIDICTNALVQEISKIFKVVNLAGYNYGSLIITHENEEFEITTFRKDLDYPDYRHPLVKFTNSLVEDLKRRDFTVNALLIDKKGEISDYFGGIIDLNEKKIKTIGNPLIRFKEDPLRILRALYLVSKHDFSFDNETFNAMLKTVHLLDKISYERKIIEIDKIISSKYSIKALEFMVKLGVVDFLPNLKLGILKTIENKQVKSLELFYLCCFFLSPYTLENKLTKKDKKFYSDVFNVYNKIITNKFNNLVLFEYKFNICNYAFKLYEILNNEVILTVDNLKIIYDSLIIKNKNDLNISFHEISKVLKEYSNKLSSTNDFVFIKTIFNEILFNVLEEKLENDFEKIKSYIIKKHIYNTKR